MKQERRCFIAFPNTKNRITTRGEVFMANLRVLKYCLECLINLPLDNQD